MKHLAFAAISIALLSGCQKETPSASKAVEASKPAQAAKSKAAALDEWKQAVVSTAKEESMKDLDNGTLVGKAMINGSEYEHTHDVMRKLRFYTPAGSRLSVRDTDIGAYISLADGDAPSFFVQTRYIGEGWLFVKSLKVMADGELVLEKDLSKRKADTEVAGRIVVEDLHFIASDEDLGAIRKIASAQKIIVRIDGDKGQENLSRQGVANFQSRIASTLHAYDTLKQALAGKTVKT